ncbi:MAG: serine O-acetyltransferase [Clostridia bacterium]|nr:serine O-acetyltransferase [Clostridia bacterium]
MADFSAGRAAEQPGEGEEASGESEEASGESAETPGEDGEEESSGEEDAEARAYTCDNSILLRAARALEGAFDQVREDVAAVRERDPAAKSDLEVLVLYSGVHAVLAYRLAHALHERGLELTARAVSQGAKFFTGIEIHPGAKIGKQLFIDHGTGVVIGETAVIGDRCTIYQGATLGGTGKESGKRHPTVGNDVMIGSGAKVLGPVRIGDHTKIAAGAVVLKDIPPHCTAVGIPARVVKQNDERVEDLDQIHIPDPVEKEFAQLRREIGELKKTVCGRETET